MGLTLKVVSVSICEEDADRCYEGNGVCFGRTSAHSDRSVHSYCDRNCPRLLRKAIGVSRVSDINCLARVG